MQTEQATLKDSAQDFSSIVGPVKDLRASFNAGVSRPLEWRRKQLDALLTMLETESERICETLSKDVGKPPFEAWGSEVAHAAAGIRYIRKRLGKWAKPERVTPGMLALPAKGRIHKDPLGVVLVIAPWNYPFELAVSPLAGALAAGNCVLLKPSEVTPNVAALLAELLPKYLDPQAVQVVQGGVPETTALLEQRFDHIFYTGNGRVGRIVMQAAARHLTPVTLELGGKSPCIVDEDADLEVACKRLVWGKFYNCGQTCVAPDYVLATEGVHDQLLEQLKKTIGDFWGEDPKSSPDLGRIVNAQHHRRVMALLPGSGEVVVGGQADESERYIAPTVLKNVTADSPIMQEEIFGPVLPVLKVESVDAAIEFINERDKPLALYVFSGNKAVHRAVTERTSSGGLVINQPILHVTCHGLPFGGVGESGMGAYHGRHSFDTFTHRKAVLTKGTMLDPDLAYPPYTESKKAWLRRLM